MYRTLKKQIQEIVDVEFGLLDHDHCILFSDGTLKKDSVHPNSLDLNNSTNFQKFGDYEFSRIRIMKDSVFFLYLKKDSKYNIQLLGLVVKNFLKDYFNKNSVLNFVKLAVENKLNDLEMQKGISFFKLSCANKIVVTLRTKKKDNKNILQIVKNVFYGEKKNIYIEMNNCDIVLVMEYLEEEYDAIFAKIKVLVSTIEEELLLPVVAGIGTKISKLQDLNISYKKSCDAIILGEIFNPEKGVHLFTNLGIGVLLSGLNSNSVNLLLEDFVDVEVFNEIDEDILKTMEKFFECNLNISETSRQMYLHRNTLVYRIEKIFKLTGLDVRKFEDAVLFKMAHMINCYDHKFNEDGSSLYK